MFTDEMIHASVRNLERARFQYTRDEARLRVLEACSEAAATSDLAVEALIVARFEDCLACGEEVVTRVYGLR